MPAKRVVSIKTWQWLVLLGCLLTMTSCDLREDYPNAARPDSSYREWRQEAELALEDHTYAIPDYIAGTGPLELIYDPSSPVFGFELYRSDTYGISNKLSGVRTVHDPYYSYTLRPYTDPDQAPAAAEILSGYGWGGEIKREQVNDQLSILNDNISEYKSGNITVYEIDEDVRNVDNSERISGFLDTMPVDSAQVLVVSLEGRMNLAFYLPAGKEMAEIRLTTDDLEELPLFLREIP
ncbi:hypothetical protein [Paenibacillus tepidiphilus]|uniref:hypothetical protein n=1 Tax=Paenibacillus tepidiphilus TaxID=2608683 RepID=UPI0012387CF4|nr:hypothetical protein [Paenibacillus tepidiphilus]